MEEQSEVSAEGKVNVIHYTYDQASRLTSVTDSTGAHMKYAYDGNGNRTQKQTQDGLTRYADDANNRLVEVAYPGMNGVTDTEYLHYNPVIARFTQERLNAQRNAGVGKGNESGNIG